MEGMMEDEIEGKEDRKKAQDGLAEGWAKGRTGIKTWRQARRR